jgi:hypothetical protein
MEDDGISGILQSRIPTPARGNSMTKQAIVDTLKDAYQTTPGFQNAWPVARDYLLKRQLQGYIPDVVIPN